MCVCSMRWLRLFSLLVLGIQSVRGFLWLCDEPQCGRPDTQPASSRIVGGQEALSGSLPWMAMVNWCHYMKCGGAILNSRFIITAAHCFDQSPFPCFDLSRAGGTEPPQTPTSTANYSVYVGKHNVLRSNDGERRMEVEKIIVHPEYDNLTQQNDVALIKLKTAIQYSSLIKPLCLPSPYLASTTPSVGQPCIVAGYGQTLGFETYSLHQVTVPVVSDKQCSQPDWYGHTFFPPDQFCAGFETGGMDACLGDSGSPLICNFNGLWYASGIVSRGEGCAEPKKPGVYANMSHHAVWVNSAMRENGHSPFCP